MKTPSSLSLIDTAHYRYNMGFTRYCVFFLLALSHFADGKTFKLGLMCPRRHLRLGWDINAAAATLAIEKAQRDNLLPGHQIE